MIVRATRRRSPIARAVTDWLDHWARETPRTRLSRRTRAGDGLARGHLRAKRAKRAQHGAGATSIAISTPERPVAILSGNSIDHAIFGFGAMIGGRPLRPRVAALFAGRQGFRQAARDRRRCSRPASFSSTTPRRSRARSKPSCRRKSKSSPARNPPRRRARPARRSFATTPATAAVDAAHARVTPDTIGKLLFTSGSTGAPKGVINTHGMMTSNQAMLKSSIRASRRAAGAARLAALEPHVRRQQQFQSRARQRRQLLYRRGPPAAQAIETTARNLREISPTVYYNVPKGYEMLLPLSAKDEALRRELVRPAAVLRLRRRRALALCARGIRAPGPGGGRVAIPMLTSLGSTETGPSAISVTAKSCAPSVDRHSQSRRRVQAVPNPGKLEARVKSPSVTPRLFGASPSFGRGVRRGRLL